MQTINPTLDVKNTSTIQNTEEEKKETKNISENIKTESKDNTKQNLSESTPVNDFHFPVINVQKSIEDSKNQEIASSKEFKKLYNIPEKFQIQVKKLKKRKRKIKKIKRKKKKVHRLQ